MHKSDKILSRHGSGPVVVRIVAYQKGNKRDIHHFDSTAEANDFEAILRVESFELVDVLTLDQGRPRVFDRWDFTPKPTNDSVDLRFQELQLKTLRGTI